MVLSNSKLSHIQSPLTMSEWIYAYYVSRCVYVVAKLGIADLLKDGSQHCNTLAAATNTHSDSLYRVLRALAGIGIFAETQPRCFELTSLADSLQSNVPDSLRHEAILRGEEWYYKSWENLMYSVETGKGAFEHLYGTDLFHYYEQNAVARKSFYTDTFVSKEESARVSALYLEAYDFSSIDKLIDVGGGNGYFLAAILEAHPAMTGILFDLPKVIDEAKNSHEVISLNDRFQLVGGSFFEAVPEGGDAYLLREVVHLFDDERAIAALKRCHQAMKEQGRLLVIERVMSPEYETFTSKFSDVHLLVMCFPGRVRNKAEFQDLFESAGFKLTKIIPTKTDMCIIEGVKTVNS
ncbi:MAG: methyltransferase [Nostoc sp. DedSLP03]|uniref:methyltransferase n=1 Tax=Nostoc sp. DedSLP03 TaxID=3075400 RepID=UPI002AD22EF9|nr:methyltransferase [Nostoc sp. DedSLP03]MDZ7970837.1 methyltransferase [Nostoc sp. DedSLP03]